MTGLRQFSAGGENTGRAATLAAIAYTTGDEMRDERNGRRYQFDESERVLFSALHLPRDAPEAWRRENFASLAEQQQFIWTSLAKFEEERHRRHKGHNQTATKHNAPIMSRHDVVILDKRLFIDGQGRPRKDGILYARQILTDFIREEYTRKGLIASFSIHDQTDGNGNFHAHIVSSYRTLTADGWGERVRPFGKAAWKKWASEKFIKARSLQNRKLAAIDAIPKAERSSKRETLTAWKTGRGFMTQRIFQSRGKFTGGKPFASFAPVPQRRAGGTEQQMPVMIYPAAAAFGKCAALSHRAERPDNSTERYAVTNKSGNGTEPRNHSGGGGGGGGDIGGGDEWLAGLCAAVAAASERLRLAMQTGIGIPAAQADLAAAKYNLAQGKGSRKGKAQQGRAVRVKFRRQKSQTDQRL